ncbi:MAG TPA: cytochrome c [Chloroflexota bacterium]|nr:cytochrome c [Chloroflexota bacterium]
MFRSNLLARWGSIAVLVVLTLVLAACAQKMRDEPKLNPDEASAFFASGTSSQPPVPDTVARGYANTDVEFNTGKDAQGNLVTEFPFPITRPDLLRGQDRFNIYCSECHGRVGNGGGVVAFNGFPGPPSYAQDRLLNAPVGHFFDVMTNGYGRMPSYANQIPTRDRWDIAAYIRALQLSQHAEVSQLPTEDQEKIKQLKPGS